MPVCDKGAESMKITDTENHEYSKHYIPKN